MFSGGGSIMTFALASNYTSQMFVFPVFVPPETMSPKRCVNRVRGTRGLGWAITPTFFADYVYFYMLAYLS